MFTNFSLYSDAYESLLESELGQASVVTSRKLFCDPDYFPITDQASIMYISMNHSTDFSSWMGLAKCLHIWDLDARGYHQGLWRMHFNQLPLYIIGVPFSPYS